MTDEKIITPSNLEDSILESTGRKILEDSGQAQVSISDKWTVGKIGSGGTIGFGKEGMGFLKTISELEYSQKTEIREALQKQWRKQRDAESSKYTNPATNPFIKTK